MSYPRLIEELIEHFSQLPGVGRRSAERMVFWFLNGSKDSTQAFASALVRLKENMRFCRECNFRSAAMRQSLFLCISLAILLFFYFTAQQSLCNLHNDSIYFQSTNIKIHNFTSY